MAETKPGSRMTRSQRKYLPGAAVLLALAPLSACRSQPRSLRELYLQTLEDMRDSGGLTEAVFERNAKRYRDVRARLEADQVVTAEDYLYAAGVLSTSPSPEDLEAARQLAERADELGEERARVLIAEATDKILVQEGGRQRYGTQFYLNPASGRWEIYPYDTGVTDATRQYMGLPPLAETLARIEALNREAGLETGLLDALQ